MALKLNRNNDSFWIDVEGGQFLVRPLSLSEENKIRQYYTKMKRGVEQPDTTKIFKERFHKTVQDWKDVEINENPNPECNRANKDWICEQFTEVAGEVVSRANEEMGPEIQEAENENLSNTSGGKKQKPSDAKNA